MGVLEYMGRDFDDKSKDSGSTSEIADLEDNNSKEESVVWPFMAVVANIPFEHKDDYYLDDGFLRDSANNLKDRWIEQGYEPVKVYPLWSCFGHSGFAVVEFGQELEGFNNTMMFVNDFEVDKHGRKDWYDSNRCIDDNKLYAWIANHEDYYSSGILGVFLRKNGVLKAVHTIEKECEVKNINVILGLKTRLEEMSETSKEIQSLVSTTISLMEFFRKQNDMLIEKFNKDLKKLQEKANTIITKLQHEDGQRKMRGNEKLSNQIIELQKKVDDKELEINQMKDAMNMVKNLTDENVEANKRTESIQEDLKEKEKEIEDLKELNRALTVKEKSSNDELTEARRLLINSMGKGKATTVQRKPGGKSSKKRSIESYNCKGTLINSGDCVLVKVDKSARPNVAKVNKIFEDKKGKVIFSITYYIWPTDTIQGKLSFHGKNEILSSDWYDEVDSKCIDGKCTVHELKDYENLEKAGPYDFISRTKYNHVENSYQEESLPVYCLCRWPAHPDYPMIFCDKCKDWFHPKCVGINTLSEVKSLPKEWLCPKCRLPESAT